MNAQIQWPLPLEAFKKKVVTAVEVVARILHGAHARAVDVFGVALCTDPTAFAPQSEECNYNDRIRNFFWY